MKLDMNPISLAYPNDSYKDIDSARHLIVLIPAGANYAAMTRRIWDLAQATSTQIRFLGLCKDAAEELSLRRGLVTMTSLLQDGNVSTELKVELGTNWVEAVKRNCDPGDLIVCLAEQHAGLVHRPLSQILQSTIKAPVYILSGLSPQIPLRPNWRFQIIAWLGSIAILMGAFLLQIQVVSMHEGWAQTTLLILSVVGEIWLIGAWNGLLS